MSMRRLLPSQAGSTLVELLVGSVIALVAIGALVQIQLTSYRSYQADTARFTAQAEASIALDRISRDIRMSSSAAFTDGGNSLTLTIDGQSVTYTYRSATRDVVRTQSGRDEVLGRNVERIAFFRETNGLTVRTEWTARLSDGAAYVVISQATPRVRTN
jgi:Tfp pilus assembly protein PilV